jgi:hypothetical protein
MPNAFDTGSQTFDQVATISRLRAAEPAIRYGRMYFREVSANGQDFGHSAGIGGVVAFSRVLADREVTVVANTNPTINFTGSVLRDPNIGAGKVSVAYSNQGRSATSRTGFVPNARFFDRNNLVGSGPGVVAPIDLKPSEIQILVPA